MAGPVRRRDFPRKSRSSTFCPDSSMERAHRSYKWMEGCFCPARRGMEDQAGALKTSVNNTPLLELMLLTVSVHSQHTCTHFFHLKGEI